MPRADRGHDLLVDGIIDRVDDRTVQRRVLLAAVVVEIEQLVAHAARPTYLLKRAIDSGSFRLMTPAQSVPSNSSLPRGLSAIFQIDFGSRERTAFNSSSVSDAGSSSCGSSSSS